MGWVSCISLRRSLRDMWEADISSRRLEREARFSACWDLALSSCLDTVDLANSIVLMRSSASDRVSRSMRDCLLARSNSSRSWAILFRVSRASWMVSVSFCRRRRASKVEVDC